MLGRISREYVHAIERFILDHQVPVVRFAKGDSKEEIARVYFKRAEREERFGVVLVGVAQEKTSGWRGWRDGGSDGHPHFEYRRQSIFPNNYYFYIRDPEWGPGFIKTVAYAPFSVWVYLNGNEWAKRQAAKLPSPFTVEDRHRGYGHELAFRQPRTMALFACLCCHQHLFAGLTNRSLRELIAGLIPGCARQMTYDLRRLAVFLTKTYTRIVNPSLAELDPKLPAEIADHAPLAQSWRAFEHALQSRIKDAALAA